jgi:hypothetical protein
MGLLSKNFNYKNHQCVWDDETQKYWIYYKGLHVGNAQDKAAAKRAVDGLQ